jgi:hypothetical protein
MLRLIHQPTARELQRIGFVMQALNDRFQWNLPSIGDVIPIGPIGGHYNIHATVICDTFNLWEDMEEPETLAVPPGYRFEWVHNGHVWSLHLPKMKITDSSVECIAHIDRGDPDRDVAGLVTHAFYDGLWGHLHGDLDPR